MTKLLTRLALGLGCALGPASAARAVEPAALPEAPGLPVHEAQGCGWYVVLGCHRGRGTAQRQLNDLGGPRAGGGAGLNVVNTNVFPNFRNGFQCVMDGPYNSRGTAASIAWTEAVPDAYVKNSC